MAYRITEYTKRRARLLGPAYRLFYEEPLHVVRGEGAWLFDADGRRYLDAYNNVAAASASLGHWQEAVDAAQAALRIDPTFTMARNNLAWAQGELAKAAGSSPH